LAKIFISEGLSIVVAMSFSVIVEAATTFMSNLYSCLVTSGGSIITAIHLARKELIRHKDRRGRFGHIVPLEDWIIPVVYKNSGFPLSMMRDAGVFRSDLESASPAIRLETGLFGRDSEILEIETRLLLYENTLLVRGVVGVGKSHLVQHLSQWWKNTGLIERAVCIDFDKQIKGVETICQEIVSPEASGADMVSAHC